MNHPPNWEAAIGELLAELSEVQEELLDVLDQKRKHMAAGNLEAMSQFDATEQDLCRRLESCHQQRAELLDQASRHGLPGDTIGRLAAALTGVSHGPLNRQVGASSQRMRLLQHHSLTNWVIAQRTVLHLSQMLEIIATGGRQKPTYGKEPLAALSGALVDQEV